MIATSSYRRDLVAEGTLSIKAAMAFTGMGRRTIEDAVRRGALPVVRMGRRVAIPRKALVQFLAERIDLRKVQ